MKRSITFAFVIASFLPLSASAAFDTSVKYGDSGNPVTEVQEFLVDQGCLSVQPTGFFGTLTLNGVKCFQTKNNINPVSGFWGSLSRAKARGLLDLSLSDSEASSEGVTTTTSYQNQYDSIVKIINEYMAKSKKKATTDTAMTATPQPATAQAVAPVSDPALPEIVVPSQLCTNDKDEAQIDVGFPSDNWDSAVMSLRDKSDATKYNGSLSFNRVVPIYGSKTPEITKFQSFTPVPAGIYTINVKVKYPVDHTLEKEFEVTVKNCQ